ncbi:1857_t:CDS:2, partial [Acaulospora morrowiae]
MSMQNGKPSNKKRKSAEITLSSKDPSNKRKNENAVGVAQSNAKNANSNSQEIDLPRGGASSRPFTFKKEKVNDDELFENDFKESAKIPVKSKSKTSKKKSDGFKNSSIEDPENSHKNKNERFVENLNFHHLTVGAFIFGQIIKINSLDIIVSLPNQMKGIVKVTHLSDQISQRISEIASLGEDDNENSLLNLSRLFNVGQWVRCMVTGLIRRDDASNGALKHNQHNIIELSLMPKDVNRDIGPADISKGFIVAASVESVEDHGYILSIGMN